MKKGMKLSSLKYKGFFQPEGLGHGDENAWRALQLKSSNKTKAFVLKRKKK